MRVVLLGAGTMAGVHALAYRKIGADLVGVYAPEPGQRERFANAHGIEAFPSVAAALEAAEVVDIATPTDTHAELTLAAFAAGRDAIVEKPIAPDLASAERMLGAARESRRRLFVAMVVRFFPQYRRAAELVREGAVGKLGVARLRRVSYRPKIAWYLDPARSGGLEVDLMIHDLDFVRWLLGEPARVFARRSGDHVQALLGFPGGAMAFVEGGWAYPEGRFRTGFDLAGDRGLIEWSSDASPPFTALFPRGDAAAQVGLPLFGLEEDPYAAELAHALDALERGASFAVSAEDGVEALRLALTVRKSARLGRPLEVRR